MTQRTGNPTDTEKKKLIDLSEVRAQKLEEKRRKTERVFFKQLLGVYTVIGDDHLQAIELNDISEDGLSFQVKFDSQKPWPSEDSAEFPVRLYFSQDSFLPVVVRVQNANPMIEDGVRYVRYGCKVDKTLSTYGAYQQFVRFLKSYSEHSQKDSGNVSVYY